MLDGTTLDAPAVEISESDEPAYWFDHASADFAVGFFRDHLRLTKDKWAGKPFALQPWQADEIVRPLFGWKRLDGLRRFRRVVVWLPRKNGKTELAAGLGLLILVGDGLQGPEVYAIAKDKDQARIVFDKAAAMVAMSPQLGRDLTVFKSAIFCQALQGAMKPLTGNAEGKHGLNASGIIGDEVHEWPDGRLYTTVHQSEAARDQPIEILISTAGIRERGYGWELWQECQEILAGKLNDPETLIVIYAADPEDDWTSEATWAKANPNLGVSVSLDYLRAECRRAQNNPRLENDFRRYHLGQWVGQAVRWLPIHVWDRGRRRDWRDDATLIGRRCYAGVDLSSTRDVTALVYVFPPEQDGGLVDVVCRFFVPEATIDERVRVNRVPYDVWVRDGALKATPGNVIDYGAVILQIMADAERWDVAGLGVDRWNSSHFCTALVEAGFPAERIGLVGQGYASLSEPSKTLEALVYAERLDHAGHPVLRWMADNVAVTTDPAGNIKPAKDKSAEKIDGIAALADGIFVWINAEPEAISVYETRGIVELKP